MPTLAEVITKINSDITANGNEEITGLVLNSVLLDIVAQINDLTGKLEDLNTDDVTSIVNAINSLKQELDDFINSQVGTLTGNDDPNETEPVGFTGRVGTIYLKMITVSVQTTPESYWIYTGINDIGWLNLTADDTFKMVVVDHYEDLPAQGQTNRIYFVQDENNTYIWNVNIFPNDYILVGGVIEGEYIDDTTFNDEFGNPVVPNTGNLYLDTITGKYYRWDGNYFLPIDQDTGGGGADYSDLTNNVLPKKDPSGNALVDSNIQDTATGVSVDGDIMMPNIDNEYIDAEGTGRIAITKEWEELQRTDIRGENLATELRSGILYSDNTIETNYTNITQLDIPVDSGSVYIYEGVIAVHPAAGSRRSVLGKKADNSFVILQGHIQVSNPDAYKEVVNEIVIPADVVSVSVSFCVRSNNPMFYKKTAQVYTLQEYADRRLTDLKPEIYRNLKRLPSSTLYKLQALSNSESLVVNIAIYGDSWVQGSQIHSNRIELAREMALLLRAEYGDGGAGWYDFARGHQDGDFLRCADYEDATDTRTGTISYVDETPSALGLCVAHASFEVGGKLILNILKGHDSATIHFNGGGGEFTYKIGAAPAVTVNTASYSGWSTTNISLNNTEEDVEFECTSGTCIIYGVNLQKAVGVRVHKFGNRGLESFNPLSVNQANWKSGLGEFDLDAFFLLLGTNDKTNGRHENDVAANLGSIIDNVREVKSVTDCILLVPGNNKLYELYDYETKISELSFLKNTSYYSLINITGTKDALNALSSFPDDFHPSRQLGKLMANKIYKEFFEL